MAKSCLTLVSDFKQQVAQDFSINCYYVFFGVLVMRGKDYKKILIVDDSSGNLLLLKNIIKSSLNYSVITSGSGEEARKALSKANPDLVLFDIIGPSSDGLILLKEMKENMQVEKIPVIVISASYEEKEAAYNLGATDYITKPFVVNDLIKKIGILLQNTT
jgi:DNA-binding response OmpR family regulator